jgi:hypothetical protein
MFVFKKALALEQIKSSSSFNNQALTSGRYSETESVEHPQTLGFEI